MEPPDPCEPLEKLVNRLNEQLDVLCSQDQEHGVFQNLIDVRSLTDMTRAMLKDTERKLANCRRHPAPPPNRPFLVTFPDPNCPRRIVETHQAQARTTVCKWVAVYSLSVKIRWLCPKVRLTVKPFELALRMPIPYVGIPAPRRGQLANVGTG